MSAEEELAQLRRRISDLADLWLTQAERSPHDSHPELRIVYEVTIKACAKELLDELNAKPYVRRPA